MPTLPHPSIWIRTFLERGRGGCLWHWESRPQSPLFWWLYRKPPNSTELYSNPTQTNRSPRKNSMVGVDGHWTVQINATNQPTYLDLFKVIFCGLYHGKSHVSHHQTPPLEKHVFLFPIILSKIQEYNWTPLFICGQAFLLFVNKNSENSENSRKSLQEPGVFVIIAGDPSLCHNPFMRLWNLSQTIHVWYIYLHSPYFSIKNQPNVGKYTSPMDPMGLWVSKSWYTLEVQSTKQGMVFRKDSLLPRDKVWSLDLLGIRKSRCWSQILLISTPDPWGIW